MVWRPRSCFCFYLENRTNLLSTSTVYLCGNTALLEPRHIDRGSRTVTVQMYLSFCCLKQKLIVLIYYCLLYFVFTLSAPCALIISLSFVIQASDIGCKGNLLLSKMVGSQIIVVPPLQYKSGLKQMMEKMAEKL